MINLVFENLNQKPNKERKIIYQIILIHKKVILCIKLLLNIYNR